MASGTAAGDGGFIWGMFEGCISGGDMGIQRRPYHKNCKCALHKSRGAGTQHCTNRCSNVSYPIRRTWSEGCLASLPCHSNSSSPVVATTTTATADQNIRRVRTLMVLHEEDRDVVSPSPHTRSDN